MEKHRLHHRRDWEEERNKMPDMVRSFEMKGKLPKRELKMAEEACVVPKSQRRFEKQYVMEAGMDLRHFAVCGWAVVQLDVDEEEEPWYAIYVNAGRVGGSPKNDQKGRVLCLYHGSGRQKKKDASDQNRKTQICG